MEQHSEHVWAWRRHRRYMAGFLAGVHEITTPGPDMRLWTIRLSADLVAQEGPERVRENLRHLYRGMFQHLDAPRE